MLNLSHKNIEVYKIALQLVKEIYRITKLLPKEEMYGLISQLRRAGVSVSSNLAEGAARKSSKEKKRFYEISRSSLVEVDTQIEICLLLDYLKKEDQIQLEKYMESVFRMLSKMIGNLELDKNQISNSTDPNPLTTS
jgi:four helix bundle protein